MNSRQNTSLKSESWLPVQCHLSDQTPPGDLGMDINVSWRYRGWSELHASTCVYYMWIPEEPKSPPVLPWVSAAGLGSGLCSEWAWWKAGECGGGWAQVPRRHKGLSPHPEGVWSIRQEQCLAHSRAVCVSYCYYYNFWWVEVLYKPDSKSRRDLIYWN